MDVILGADAIRPPLTGIGRYALELATRVPNDSRVERLRLFSLLGWVEDPAAMARSAGPSAPAGVTLRNRLARNTWAVRAYEWLRPHYTGWKLRAERNALFHSPHYFLPAFPGRTVATVHDLSHIRFPEFHPSARVEFMNRALPGTLAQADYLITDSEFVRGEVIAHFGWPEDRVTSVPLGVDSRFSPNARSETPQSFSLLGLNQGEYSLFVGTVEPRKNLDRLLIAYASLPKELRRRWPLVLAGDRGWRSTETHARIAAAASEGWLRYLSFVDEDLLPALYAHARLFVYPSLYEGFGLPPLEAMASGIPVVTSAVASIPEVVGTSALMIDPTSTEELKAALEIGLEDETWRSRARDAGLSRAAEFTWDACVEKTVAVYCKVGG